MSALGSRKHPEGGTMCNEKRRKWYENVAAKAKTKTKVDASDDGGWIVPWAADRRKTAVLVQVVEVWEVSLHIVRGPPTNWQFFVPNRKFTESNEVWSVVSAYLTQLFSSVQNQCLSTTPVSVLALLSMDGSAPVIQPVGPLLSPITNFPSAWSHLITKMRVWAPILYCLCSYYLRGQFSFRHQGRSLFVHTVELYPTIQYQVQNCRSKKYTP